MTMADKDPTALARDQLAKNNEARKQTEDDQKRAADAKPTPTQEENDLARLGAPIREHEDDGSGPEPKFVVTRQQQAESTPSRQTYQTRSAAPARSSGTGASSEQK